ncbi:MAG: aspartate-semialdehyde dehydrogenase [Thermodesulfobacteriota bacterium]|nr:aspartate-semialdehyde dehydrogenase [Thermodesulfobacteriota bacterium]
MEKRFNVAVVGATGAVGNMMVKILEERRFPVKEIKFLASERSAGKPIEFMGETMKVEKLEDCSFDNMDIGLFSPGASVSMRFAPVAAEKGCVVIDNTSAFRTDHDVPLVVPEVNPEAIGEYTHRNIIANPNCSTIQMVLVLKPIHDAVKVKRVVVSSYQSVSGTGKDAIEELLIQTRALLEGKDAVCEVYPHRIAFNCIPQIDIFLENGYTKEEMKMVNETKKIIGDESIKVTATTVRVPVFYAHSESVNVETERKLTSMDAKELLARSKGVVVIDDPLTSQYPLATMAEGKDETFVGRIREDESIPNGLNMWVVSDNLRKGAALNAIQIAEILIEKYL